MLHVKIDLVPYGNEAGRKTLQDVYIGNDGTGGPYVGNYDVWTEDPRPILAVFDYPRPAEMPGYVGRIENVARLPVESSRPYVAALALELVQQKLGDRGQTQSDETLPRLVVA